MTSPDRQQTPAPTCSAVFRGVRCIEPPNHSDGHIFPNAVSTYRPAPPTPVAGETTELPSEWQQGWEAGRASYRRRMERTLARLNARIADLTEQLDARNARDAALAELASSRAARGAGAEP